jgi:tRNA modification GTPase
MDTIFALATAQGKAGVAIVRVSGDLAFQSVEKLTGRPLASGRPSLRNIYESTGGLIDQALILAFDKGASFTGEQSVEFQLHGSPAIVAAVTRQLSDLDGFRVAEPGEFTRRALLNGQLDLAQVEGLADLIEAETEAQRIQAIRVFDGRLGELTSSWRSRLIRAAALLEATIDFADEEVPVDVTPEVSDLLNSVNDELTSEAEGSKVAERIRNGFEVAIVGPPNVGKSTLLNRLAGREAALTSTIAGTTRDIIEVRLDLNGLPVTVLDTAGIRDTEDEIEALGVDLATRRAEGADLRVFLSETGADDWPVKQMDGDIQITAKADLGASSGLGVSGLTGDGVSELINQITIELGRRASGGSNLIRERHRIAIRECLAALSIARNRLSEDNSNSEIIAEDIRMSVRALDPLIGSVGVENILDEVFSSFCLGK